MDDADYAARHEEAERANARDRVACATRLKPVGYCRYCLRKLGAGVIFCDADCGEGWEAERAAERRNGRRGSMA